MHNNVHLTNAYLCFLLDATSKSSPSVALLLAAISFFWTVCDRLGLVAHVLLLDQWVYRIPDVAVASAALALLALSVFS